MICAITIPSKTQTYMAAGKPILMGVQGDSSNLLEKAGAGTVCRPDDPQSIADVVAKLFKMLKNQINQMNQNGLEFYQKELSMAVGVDKF